MAKIAYQEFSFRAETRSIIDQADAICRDYAAQGYDLTLRQLYYQFVARAILENSEKSYKRLGEIVGNARLAGLLDWDHLEDRTRNVRANSHWSSPAAVIESAARSYALDKWANQDYYVEIWVEKEALAGVVARVAGRLDVPFEEYNPPPNPAKTTDSRFESYMAEFGDESWELDALDPTTLDALIESHVLSVRDEEAWADMEEREAEGHAQLSTVVQHWHTRFVPLIDDIRGAGDA